MNKDYGRYFGSLMMIGFGILAFYRWYQTQLLFFLLLVIRDFCAGYFFLKRKPSKEQSGLSLSILAYISSAMPLLYFDPSTDIKALFALSSLLSILGFLLVTFATLELGSSMGISPARRELVKSGIYRYIKHPMYTGYIISESGLALLNPFNGLLLLLSVSLYFVRAKSENHILKETKLVPERI